MMIVINVNKKVKEAKASDGQLIYSSTERLATHSVQPEPGNHRDDLRFCMDCIILEGLTDIQDPNHWCVSSVMLYVTMYLHFTGQPMKLM